MQIKGLHKSIYKLYGYGRKQEVLIEYRKKYQTIVSQWERLKKAGTNEKEIPSFVGCSRATYYRSRKILIDLERGKLPPSKARIRRNKPKWGEAEKQLVLGVRRENSSYGKFKITHILKRDHQLQMSESTVGRILKHLLRKGVITKSLSAQRAKKKRNFTKSYAKPWQFKKYEQMKLGEHVQVDHMTVRHNGVTVKHFQAWERKSKYIGAQIYTNASSKSARKFLLELIEQTPFEILSIQVDGGSEFMAEFEDACRQLNIPLYVLPPASPKKNGGVERGNRIFREEFYAKPSLADSLGAIRNDLKDAVAKYNDYRPHFSLAGLTPLAYIGKHNSRGACLSQNT